VKFKVKFNRVLTEVQLVEGIIEADNQEAANEMFLDENFSRFLVLKREMTEKNNGTPTFEKIG
jgi:hypothetical protein